VWQTAAKKAMVWLAKTAGNVFLFLSSLSQINASIASRVQNHSDNSVWITQLALNLSTEKTNIKARLTQSVEWHPLKVQAVGSTPTSGFSFLLKQFK
jgi:hypothetical protein